MFRRSPTRNNRSKGSIKGKHVLQICLLLGICFWLIYQVKHSHDKKKEFDETDSSSRLSMKSESDDGKIVKLGRKDLHPRIEEEEVNKSESREEDDEEENRGEEEQKKNEVGEEQEKEGKDQGEERRNVVEDEEEEEEEKQEGQREKVEEEGEEEQREEKNGEVEEEHEQEEEEIEKKETEEDEERGGGDDEIDRRDQEKADSEPEHEEEEEKEKEEEGDDKKTGERIEEEEEKEKGGEHENEHEAREEQYKADDASSAVAHNIHSTSTKTAQVSFEKMDNVSRSIVKGEINGIPNGSRLMEENVTSAENGNFSSPLDDSPLNSTLATHSNDLPEGSNNSSESSGFSQKSSLNETAITSDLTQNSTVLVKAENENVSSETESDALEVILSSNTTTVNREDTAGNDDSGSIDDSGRAGDKSNESEGGPRDVVQDDPIDSSDLHATEDVKDDRVDLDTLPDIRTDVNNNSIEESAAE